MFVELNFSRLIIGASLTYGELDERAGRLSIWLQRRFSLPPETLVAICLDRSPVLIVCILAILKVCHVLHRVCEHRSMGGRELNPCV